MNMTTPIRQQILDLLTDASSKLQELAGQEAESIPQHFRDGNKDGAQQAFFTAEACAKADEEIITVLKEWRKKVYPFDSLGSSRFLTQPVPSSRTKGIEDVKSSSNVTMQPNITKEVVKNEVLTELLDHPQSRSELYITVKQSLSQRANERDKTTMASDKITPIYMRMVYDFVKNGIRNGEITETGLGTLDITAKGASWLEDQMAHV